MSKDMKLLLRYVTPSMGGMLIAGVYSIVDTFFIGISMGETGLASVAITWPVVMLGGALGDMIGTGAGIAVAQEFGAGNPAGARRIFGTMLLLEGLGGILVAIPLLLFLTPLLKVLGTTDELMGGAWIYSCILISGFLFNMFSLGMIAVMRNDSRPLLAMLVISTGLAANIVLDFLFIMVFGWGVAGAAVATVAAQGIATGAALAYFLSNRTGLRIRRDMLGFDRKTAARILTNGIPTLGVQLSIIAMLFMHNLQSLRYGLVAGLAAYTVISAVESMGSMLMTGLAAGVQPLASYFHGAGKNKRKLRIGYYGLYMAAALGVVMTAVSLLGYRIFPHWFGLEGEVAELAARGMLLSASAFLLLGVVRVGTCYFQSVGLITPASVMIYGDSCFAMPLCLFVLPPLLGMDGVWLAMPLSRVILFAMMIGFWKKYIAKRTRDERTALAA